MADQRRKQNHSPGVRSVNTRKRSARKSKKRRKLRAGIFLTVLLAAGTCIFLSLTVLFRIDAVEALPSEHYTADQIAEAAQISQGTNLFRADRSGAANRIRQTLPYIQSAEVSIVLPDKIVISVKETQPILQLQQDGLYYLVNEDFKVLEKSDQQMGADLPVVTGAGITAAEPGQTVQFEREELPATLRTLSQQISENEFSNVTGIDISKLYSIELQYGKNLVIKLGSVSDLAEKFQLARYVIDNKLDASKPGTLDLSQKNGEAVFRPNYGNSGIIIPPKTDSSSSG